MKDGLHILALAANTSDYELIEHELHKAKIKFLCRHAKNRKEYLRGLEQFSPDLVISEYAIPGFDGLHALSLLQKKSIDIPVILVGEVAEDFAIQALKKGATDYVPKNRLSRLVPAVRRAILEREHKQKIKESTDELQKAQETLSSLLKAPFNGLLIIAKDGKIMALNSWAAKKLGRSVEELTGKSIYTFYDAETVKARKAKLDEIFRTGKTVYFEDERDNFYFAHTVYPIFRADAQKVDRVAWFIMDITEHRLADEKMKRLYSLLVASRSISQSLIRVTNEQELFQQICDALLEVWYIKFAWIGLVEKSHFEVIPVAQAGYEEGYLKGVKVRWDDSKLGNGPSGMAVKTAKPFVMRDIENDSRFEPWRKEARKRGYASSIVVPIIHQKEVIGIINIYSESKDAFGNEEIEYLMEVAGDVGFGVKSLRLEKDVRESDSRFAQFIEGLPMAVMVFDAAGRQVYASRKQRELMGKGAAGPEVSLEKLSSYYSVYVAGSEQVYPMKKAPITKALTGETAMVDDMEIHRKDRVIPVEVLAAPIFNENGKVAYVVVTSMEITERKKREKKLAEEKEILSITLRSTGEGVISTDLEGRVMLINKAAETFTGWTKGSALGEHLSKVFHVIDEKTAHQVERIFQADRMNGVPNRAILIAKDGKKRIIEYNCAFMRDSGSKIVGAVLVFTDVTEKRFMEEELIKKAKISSMNVLASGIAHDFNNILVGVLGNISLAKTDTNPNAAIYEYLNGATLGCLRAKDLTQQLLTFSKGGMPIKKILQIGELVKDAAGFSLRGSKSKAEFSFPDELWPVEVDEGQMGQVFNNLFINADQAMINGGIITASAENIMVDARNEFNLKPGRYVKISVQDRGIGIPKENIDKIFDPFFTSKEKGSGIGLAVTLSIIRNHDGHVSVKSEVGVGTIFSIFLPASEEKPRARKYAECELPVGRGKVLLMDDEESVRDMATKMLKRIGYEVEVTKEGSEALMRYRQALESGEPFDAVLTDLTIPGGMGGKDLARELLKLDPKARIIASSGYSNDPVMADHAKFGFVGAINKPYELEQLGEELYNAIMKDLE